jgi:hypothetical protein
MYAYCGFGEGIISEDLCLRLLDPEFVLPAPIPPKT